MSTTAVGHCSHCAAVVNLHWPNCLVCHAALSAPLHEAGSPTITEPDHPQEVTTAAATLPLKAGWLVGYRNQQGALCGGCDDRQHGTVQECRWTAVGWMVHLTDGQRLPLSIIRGVTKPDGTAWTVREHGYDGEGHSNTDAEGAMR